jgi:tRNA uridine 5-carboxymethylaminomethyl modification enzyme
VIAANAERSPMFNGAIQGIGPRYCPSIEDKVRRFPDKKSHGLFLEPEGWRTTEVYVQGANTSLPIDVQLAALRTIPALRDARITRYGYAVEYDAIEPAELTPWFAAKRVAGLFLAGQVNGTSGYEEAAGQGLLAGVNAARFVGGDEPLTLRRDQGYIGVMADDLTAQEFVEPYRMLTSRAEHRLLLRADNAELRLGPLAYEAGLIDGQRYRAIVRHGNQITDLVSRIEGVFLSPNSATQDELAKHGLPEVARSQTALDYLRRPDVTLARLLSALTAIHPTQFAIEDINPRALSCAEIEAKYAAYIEKELAQIERIRDMEDARLGPQIEYAGVSGLRNEAREKLAVVQPATLGQASRIPGVTPGDLAVLVVHLRRERSNSPEPATLALDR